MKLTTVKINKITESDLEVFQGANETDYIGETDNGLIFIVPENICSDTLEIINIESNEANHYECVSYMNGLYIGTSRIDGEENKIVVQFEVEAI